MTRRFLFGLLGAAAAGRRAIEEALERRAIRREYDDLERRELDEAFGPLVEATRGPYVPPPAGQVQVGLETEKGNRLTVVGYPNDQFGGVIFIAPEAMKITQWSISGPASYQYGDLCINGTPIMSGNLNGDVKPGDVLAVHWS
jgi:hypothetical protein